MKAQFKRSPETLWAVLAAVVWVAGCASTTPAPVVDRSPTPAAEAAPAKDAVLPAKDAYVVKKGDTLYSIALDHGLDYKDVAAWNQLDNPNRILIGQPLRITPPGERPAVAEAMPVVSAPVAEAKPIGMAGAVEKRTIEGNTETLKREPRAGKEPYSDETYARLQQGAAVVVARAEPKPEAKPEAKVETRVETKPTESGDDPAWIWPANGKVLAGFNDSTNKGVDIAGKLGEPVVAAGDGKVVYSGTGLRGYGQLVIVKHNATYLSAYAHNSKILVGEGQAVTRGQKIAEMGNSDADQVKLHFEVRRQGKPVDPLRYLPPRQ